MSVQNRIKSLNEKHDQLEKEITALELSPSSDDLKITDLKKQKLQIKDEITSLSAELDAA